jgi:hypothetical protein
MRFGLAIRDNMDYQNRGRKSKLFAQISCRTGLGQASGGTRQPVYRQGAWAIIIDLCAANEP